MSLARLELVGFKSFMNPVTLELRDGITCILGPNGCGKTNIVDAVRWVLGEQSARQLRGAKMENVIFNGTEKHKPIGCASVSMTVNNERGFFPLDYSEITITRKVYRSGISDYFINKSPCRLRDIRELFADTGTGNHSYAVIEQEMIDCVLNDSHGERRQMFEEAAGIVKYRMRREEAQRKLKLTEGDLLRLDDIIEELSRNVRALRYQVGKTKRYRRISERIRSYGLILLRRSLSEQLRSKRDADEELTGYMELSRRDDVSLEESERLMAEEKLKLLELEQTCAAAQNRRYDIRRRIQSAEERIIQAGERMGEAQRTIERAGREIEAATERLESIAERSAAARTEFDAAAGAGALEQEEIERLGARFEEIRGGMEKIQAELIGLKQLQLDFIHGQARASSSIEHYEKVTSDLDERTARMREQITALETETARLGGERDARGSALEEVRRRLAEFEAGRAECARLLSGIEQGLAARETDLAERRADLAARRGRHDLLVGMREEFEGFPPGARRVLRAGDPRVRGALAEMIRTAPEYRRALEAVLGGIMDGVVVEDFGGAIDIVAGLAREGHGGARLLVGEMAPAGDADAPSAPGLIGALASIVEAPGDARGVVERLLEDVYLFEDLESALAFYGSPAGATAGVVTVSGIYWRRGLGIYYAGAADGSVSLLGRGEEIEHLAVRIKESEQSIAMLEEQCRRLRGEKEARGGEAARLATEESGAREELALRREAFQAAERDYLMQCEKRALSMKQLDELEAARGEALSRLEEARLTLSLQEEEDGSGAARLEVELAGLREERERIEALVTEKKVRLASLRGGCDRLNEELRGLGEMENQFRSIVTQRGDEIESWREELVRLERSIEEQREEAAELLGLEQACERELEEARARLEERRERVAALETEAKNRARERERIFERISEAQVRLSAIETRMKDLVERARELYGEDLSCWLDGFETPATPEEEAVSAEMLEAEKRRLEGLGPVNLAAVEEYEEKKKRLDFLEGQRADLAGARVELEEGIREINRRARRMFLETFRQVRGNFGSIFSVLFEGGEADLELGEGSDPLEADIVISARPAGKRIQDISLLSGGERALTALALLFALYQAKPSPFCIFDEVDAPLDDANIRRFIRMLEKFSAETQFIIITHNKRTMEAADRLFGITMEEKGVSRIVSVDLSEVEGVLSRRGVPAASAKEPAAVTVSSN